MNLQRKAIYENRNEALGTDNLKDKILGMLKDTITAKVYEKFVAEHKEDWDIEGLKWIFKRFLYVWRRWWKSLFKKDTKEGYTERIYNALVDQYNKKKKKLVQVF